MSGLNPVGRPAVAIDPGSPFAEFALELRGLRDSACLNLRQLADRSGFSTSVLSEATNGRSLPALDVTLAYIRSCDGDLVKWAERWFDLTTAQRGPSAGDDEEPTDPGLEACPEGPVPEAPSARPSTEGMEARSDVSCRVSTAAGQVLRLPEGSRLVFGRGPGVDLLIGAGRGLSRTAGIIRVGSDGAWIANISRTHALYVSGDGYRIRLPRVDGDEDPTAGWLLHAGTATVGSRTMMDDGLELSLTVDGRHRWPDGVAGGGPAPSDTVLPLYLDPMTKLFLVALLWCRPWLLDPTGAAPLPRTPEIARQALEATAAQRELERFDSDPEFRDRLSARVAEHIKVLRRKITERGLSGPDVRLSDEVAVRILIEHGTIGAGDLRLLLDPAWCTRQEDLWWAQG